MLYVISHFYLWANIGRLLLRVGYYCPLPVAYLEEGPRAPPLPPEVLKEPFLRVWYIDLSSPLVFVTYFNNILEVLNSNKFAPLYRSFIYLPRPRSYTFKISLTSLAVDGHSFGRLIPLLESLETLISYLLWLRLIRLKVAKALLLVFESTWLSGI